MAERSAKVRKVLGSIGLSTNVSQLASVLAALHDLSESERNDLLSLGRKQLQHSMNDVWEKVHAKLTVSKMDGTPLALYSVSWTKAFQFATRTMRSFQSLIRTLNERQPNSATSPWHLSIYADETTPGNVLSLDVARKTFVVRVTIREFGPHLVKNPAVWIPILFVRSSVLGGIAGGMAAVWRMVLRQLFIVEQVSTRGVPVELGSEFTRLYFAVGNFLLDGDAVRGVHGAKGGQDGQDVQDGQN